MQAWLPLTVVVLRVMHAVYLKLLLQVVYMALLCQAARRMAVSPEHTGTEMPLLLLAMLLVLATAAAQLLLLTTVAALVTAQLAECSHCCRPSCACDPCTQHWIKQHPATHQAARLTSTAQDALGRLWLIHAAIALSPGGCWPHAKAHMQH